MPSSGPCANSVSRSTSYLNCRVSMATWYLRAYVCSVPVMNPWGKKKTGSGKDTGRPPKSQPRKNSTRWTVSLTHDPSVFSVAKLTAVQTGGRTLLVKETYISSNSDDMITKPLIARCSSLREERMRERRRLNLTISWASTVSKDVSRPFGCTTNVLGPLSSSSSAGGIFEAMSAMISSTVSSAVLPPPPPPPSRGCRTNMDVSRAADSFRLYVISAFSCIPKISGSSTMGKEPKYAVCVSSAPVEAGWYVPLLEKA
mmetsp:Transcript_17785/g.59986  ORF Transcript_17785/g.59986 Transcript_17785/m.59986 type:complete len:257 (-) Transcript_17785:5523-6293(-)